MVQHLPSAARGPDDPRDERAAGSGRTPTQPDGPVRLRPMAGTGLVIAVVLFAFDAVLAAQTIALPKDRAGWAATPLVALVVLTILWLVLHTLTLAALTERLDRGPDFTEHAVLWRAPIRIPDVELRAIRATGWFITFDGGPRRRFVTGCGIGMPVQRLLRTFLPLLDRRPELLVGQDLTKIYLTLHRLPGAPGPQV